MIHHLSILIVLLIVLELWHQEYSSINKWLVWNGMTVNREVWGTWWNGLVQEQIPVELKTEKQMDHMKQYWKQLSASS